MNASIAIQVLPQTQDKKKLIEIVDKVIAYLKSTGLNMVVGPFETTLEGDFDKLMEVIKNCQLIATGNEVTSVLSYVKINYDREGDVLSIDEKITKHQ